MLQLIFCGDTVPTPDSAQLFASGDVDALFGDIVGHFAAADRVIVNLECALTESQNAIRKFGPNLKGPPAAAQTLRKAGVTDCSLANNHVLDFGVAGLRNTIRTLESAKLGWFGAGEDAESSRCPLTIEKGGLRVAVLAVAEHEYSYALPGQPGAAPFDPFETLADIVQLKRTYDAVVVLYHGGKEQCEYPSPRLRSACRVMACLGADVVLCQHSHIIGCAEEYAGSTIVYGQGNFHFVRYGTQTPGWTSGLMVKVTFNDEIKTEFLPVVAGAHGICLAQGEAKERLIRGFTQRSQMLRDGSWLQAWEAFCASISTPYMQSVRDAFSDPEDPRKLEHFAHYLDCEAHMDVYHTLFKTWHARREDGA